MFSSQINRHSLLLEKLFWDANPRTQYDQLVHSNALITTL